MIDSINRWQKIGWPVDYSSMVLITYWLPIDYSLITHWLIIFYYEAQVLQLSLHKSLSWTFKQNVHLSWRTWRFFFVNIRFRVVCSHETPSIQYRPNVSWHSILDSHENRGSRIESRYSTRFWIRDSRKNCRRGTFPIMQTRCRLRENDLFLVKKDQ